jgi:hypothetical protein
MLRTFVTLWRLEELDTGIEIILVIGANVVLPEARTFLEYVCSHAGVDVRLGHLLLLIHELIERAVLVIFAEMALLLAMLTETLEALLFPSSGLARSRSTLSALVSMDRRITSSVKSTSRTCSGSGVRAWNIMWSKSWRRWMRPGCLESSVAVRSMLGGSGRRLELAP